MVSQGKVMSMGSGGSVFGVLPSTSISPTPFSIKGVLGIDVGKILGGEGFSKAGAFVGNCVVKLRAYFKEYVIFSPSLKLPVGIYYL